MIGGGRWLVLTQSINQPIRMIIIVLLTRLLVPEDFGLVAKSLAVTGIADLVLVQGLLGAIIQDKNIEDHQINTIYCVSILWSFFIAAIIYLSADAIAQFYSDDKVAWIARVASISIVFSGIQLVPSALIRKKLQFRKIFIATTTGVVVSSAVAIYFTLNGYGYKALIFQFVTNTIINGVLIIKMSNWTPKFNFELKEVSSHVKFGLNMMGSNLLNYLVRNADDVALGRIQPDAVLGVYSRAYFLMLMPLNIVNQIFNTLLFPTFSSIQNDNKKVVKIFLTAQEIIVSTMFPIITLFFFNTEIIIEYILGVQWIESALLFKIFIPLLLLQLFTAPISSVYMSLGKVGTAFKFNLVANPLLIVAIVLAAQYGAVHVASTVTVLAGISSFIFYIKGLGYLKVHFVKHNLIGLKWFIIAFLFYFILECFINPTFQLGEIYSVLLSCGEVILLYVFIAYSRPQLIDIFKIIKKK